MYVCMYVCVCVYIHAYRCNCVEVCILHVKLMYVPAYRGSLGLLYVCMCWFLSVSVPSAGPRVQRHCTCLEWSTTHPSYVS